MKKARWIFTLALLLTGLCQPLHPKDQEFTEQPEQPIKPLVVLERSGGFAGVQEKFEIYLDGNVINAEGVKRQVPVSRLDSLVRKITGLDSANLSKKHVGGEFCFDCFRYRITVISPEGKTIVIHMDELEMGADSRISALARSIRDLVFGMKWN